MEIREQILQLIRPIAPETDVQSLDTTNNLREELDIDSVDWLNLIVSIDETFGIDIPESDYEQLTSLDSIIRYVSRRKDVAKPG